MATYVISDIHGCFKEFQQMLQKIEFSEDDRLYLAGDYIDRGKQSLEMLRWLECCPENVNPIKGNHDAEFAENISIMRQIDQAEELATAIIEHITYDVMDAKYDTDIFTEPTIKGKLGTNAMKANKHLYDHIVYDSTNEKAFAEKLDTSNDVAVYVKLPDGFYISTPVGKYNPDWAIAFYEGNIKHIYFVAETKGSMSSMQLRLVEEAKIHCAREHFKAISGDNIVYDVVDSYTSLMEKVMK